MQKTEQIISRQNLPQVLLISGSGRNCGKTSLACEIINMLSSTTAVIGLKISPHFHQLSEKQELLFENKNFRIFRETDDTSKKDSSRMLNAGADHSYYIQCEDNYIPEAWDWISGIIPEGVAVVSESGSLATIFKPGLHLLVEGKNPDKMKRSYLKNKEYSDKIVLFNGDRFSLDISTIYYEKYNWSLKDTEDDQVRRSA